MDPRVKDLTLEEKAGLLSGASFWTTRAVEHAGIPSMTLTDGPHGVRLQSGSADHLGLNQSEPATSFPTAAATGSSWDPDLLEEMGRALGAESRRLGVDVLLGPGVNIKRSPLGGRNFEYFSEDPLLSGAIGAAWVRGVESQGVGSSVKHFAANNQETDRMRVSAEVDERTLREIYFPAFESAIVDGGASTVMCSYNKVNGVYASQNSWLLTEVLRGDWGFDGYVMSDWGAVADPVAAVAAGLDLEMPSAGTRSPQRIVDAVRTGELDESVVDQAVSHLISVHERLLARRGDQPEADLDAHHALARRIAADSTVLLKNDGVLPLDAAAGGPIAVIGEFARTPRYQGAGSSHINPVRLDAALDAIRDATERVVEFAAGYTLDGDDESLRAEAVALAGRADTVVVFLGLPPEEESEGFDRTHLLLPQTQRTLLAEIAAVNSRVVVVLSNGGVVILDEIAEPAAAVLEMWLAGQAGGTAAADVLFGTAEPGGRLAETVPHSLAHTPSHVNWPGENSKVHYGERVYVGYRWYDRTDREVAYPFGFGLGYTTFAYSNLVVTVPSADTAHAVVEFTVENTGARAGSDVAQVYVGDVAASVDRPLRELKGFQKVRLAPGESRRVRVELGERAFAFWGSEGWTVEPGEFTVEVGNHSRSLPLRETIRLDVAPPAFTLTSESTLGEWIRHPSGESLLRANLPMFAEVGTQTAGIDTMRLFEGIPLRTMLSFVQNAAPESFDVDETMAHLLAEVGADGD